MSTITICKRSTVRFDFPSNGYLECDPLIMNTEMDELRSQHGEADYVESLSNHILSCIITDGGPALEPDVSQTLEFNDTIVAIVNGLNEARKKKVEQIVSSLCFTQESPAITENGTTKQSEHGSNVTVTQSDDASSLTGSLTT